MNNNFLNDSWCLYFHDPYDTIWDNTSYKLLTTISSIEEYVRSFIAFKPLFSKGMFFLMRTDIMPRWEDESNAKGGCFSFKIMNNDIDSKWFSVCSNILGENIGINDDVCSNINGVSISPKKFFYIIRIWIKNKKYAKKEYYNLDIPRYSTIMYKNHIET